MAKISIPADIYHRIFEHLLLDPEPSSLPMDDVTADSFFRTAAPNNLACVSREWRAFILHSPSLWSKFSLSFANPSDCTLEKAFYFVLRHVTRSQNKPLTCTIRISGACDGHRINKIVLLLAKHQMRWRKMHLWFDGSHPITTIDLIPRELGLLEEFSATDASHYRTLRERRDGYRAPGPFQSLTRLNLEMTDSYDDVVPWLKRVPNIEEMDLNFLPSNFSGRGLGQDAARFPMTQYARLRTLRVGAPKEAESAPVAGALVVYRLACPVLRELSLYLDGDACIEHLRNFFLRGGATTLEHLDLQITEGTNTAASEEGRTTLVNTLVDVVSLLSNLSIVRIVSRFLGDVGPLLEALSGLQHLAQLEMRFVHARPSQFVDFIKARRNPVADNGVKLKSLTLWQCSAIRFGRRFTSFGPGLDQSRLTGNWGAVRDYISTDWQLKIA